VDWPQTRGSKVRHRTSASVAKGLDSIWLTSASLLSPSQSYEVTTRAI
jgi:hypothetical protein